MYLWISRDRLNCCWFLVLSNSHTPRRGCVFCLSGIIRVPDMAVSPFLYGMCTLRISPRTTLSTDSPT